MPSRHLYTEALLNQFIKKVGQGAGENHTYTHLVDLRKMVRIAFYTFVLLLDRG